MSKSMQAVSLNILDKEYKIACAADEKEALIDSALELDKQMRKIRASGKVIGADRIAVLAALNLTHELAAGPKVSGTSDPHSDLTDRLTEMRHKIENVLETP